MTEPELHQPEAAAVAAALAESIAGEATTADYFAPVAAPQETPSVVDLALLVPILIAGFVLAMLLGAMALGVWAHMRGVPLASLASNKAQQIALAVPFQIALYAVMAAIAIPLYRMRWHRSFAGGIHWNFDAAASRAVILVPFGIVLSLLVSVVSSRIIKMPTNAPIYELFKNTSLAWAATLFGSLIAPAAEEVAFRGFLLPVCSRNLGRIAGVAITSAVFALMHASQIGHAWGAVAMLFCVSVVLCEVRLRFNSVAASTLVHMSYNSALFAAMIIATGGYRHFDKLPA